MQFQNYILSCWGTVCTWNLWHLWSLYYRYYGKRFILTVPTVFRKIDDTENKTGNETLKIGHFRRPTINKTFATSFIIKFINNTFINNTNLVKLMILVVSTEGVTQMVTLFLNSTFLRDGHKLPLWSVISIIISQQSCLESSTTVVYALL